MSPLRISMSRFRPVCSQPELNQQMTWLWILRLASPIHHFLLLNFNPPPDDVLVFCSFLSGLYSTLSRILDLSFGMQR